MSNIFIGFLLVFLDVTINAGRSTIGLIPDFLGYILMAKGLVEMAEESPLFMKVKPFATFMIVYTGILYFCDLLGISISLGIFSYLLGIVSTVISLYISYNIVMGVRDMEENYNAVLNGDSLKSTWTTLAVFSVITYALILVPVLNIICLIVAFIVAVVFLISFNRAKNLYYELTR